MESLLVLGGISLGVFMLLCSYLAGKITAWRNISFTHQKFIQVHEVFRDLEAKVWDRQPAQHVEIKPLGGAGDNTDDLYYKIQGFKTRYSFEQQKLTVEYYANSSWPSNHSLDIDLTQPISDEVKAQIEVLLSDKKRSLVRTAK